MYDEWKFHSVVTVDRRDGRDEVAIRKDVFTKKFAAFKQSERLEFCISRRNVEVVECVWRIQTKSVREMKSLLSSNGLSLSLRTIISLKQFYIQPATKREKASC